MAIVVEDLPRVDAPPGDGDPDWVFVERPEERWARCELAEVEEGIRQLDAAIAALQREQAAALGVFAQRHGPELDGCATPADWLMLATACSRATARSEAAVALGLGELPAIADAFGRGELSLDQVAQLVRFATPATDTEWAADAQGRSVADLEALARSLRPPRVSDTADARARRSLRLRDVEGETRITGRVPLADGAVLRAFLEPLAAAVPADCVAGTFDPWGARLADALCARAAEQPPEGTRSRRAVVTVHATPEQLTGEAETGAVLEDGMTPLARGALARILCDCDLEVHVDHPATGATLGIGRASRTVPAWLARVVLLRDGRCRVPGCDRPGTEIHHLVPWEHEGPTDTPNLVAICWHHHQRIHTDGFALAGDADHDLEWRDPNGRHIATSRPTLRPDVHQRLFGHPPPRAT
ncbi:MAG: DUF222 domain-containing protein [Acidimicrobiales bacterium]|nr:DUF222 domain-containing protein [Acidimicrobiales bacterium]